jgi:hypothetical protein
MDELAEDHVRFKAVSGVEVYAVASVFVSAFKAFLKVVFYKIGIIHTTYKYVLVMHYICVCVCVCVCV